MNIKTLTGSTIHAALQEARSLFGDHVVLLESVAPRDGQPARITVMADSAASAPVAAALPAPRQVAPVRAAHPALMEHAASARPENVSGPNRSRIDLSTDDETPFARPAAPVVGPAARGSLYPSRSVALTPPVPPASPAAPALTAEALETLLAAPLQALQARLDAMERRFGAAIIGAAHAFAAHPLFAALLGQGMRPQTATALFDALAQKGYGPDSDEASLRWGLAQEMRRRLDPTAPRRAVGTQAFIGPSGAGKTSLVVKLAQHNGFYGRRKTGVIVILPEDEDLFHQPVDVYRRFGLAVQSIEHPSQMPAALDRMRSFDQILIDTPPLPLRRDGMRPALAHLKSMLAPVMPLQVNLVVSAAAALDGFTADVLDKMPLAPDAVALTHLDETRGWGRVAEWLMALARPVPFVSAGPRTPHDLFSYSPTWFVEEMMQLG